MTYSPDARAKLADRLRDLFPGAHEFTFATAPDEASNGGWGLVGLCVTFDGAAFDDRSNGLAYPGERLTQTLASLGWSPDSEDGDPVDDDVPTVSLNRPRPNSPVRLHELWRLIEAAFTSTTPDYERDAEVPLR